MSIADRVGRWKERIRNRPVLFGSLGGVVTVVLVVVLVWFQPQALLFDTVVEEDFPIARDDVPGPDPADGGPGETAPTEETTPGETTAEPESPPPEEPPGPVALASGSFESRSRYTVEGTATVYRLEDGSRILRLEEFSSTNGPDLFVYLTTADSADSDDDLNRDFVDLGVLKGNIGSQNYEIPDDVDLDRYDTVVVWCRRFTVGFGAADLVPVP